MAISKDFGKSKGVTNKVRVSETVHPEESYRVVVFVRSQKNKEQAYASFNINDFGGVNLSASAGRISLFGDTPFKNRWEYIFIIVIAGLFVLLYNVSQGKAFSTIKK